MAFRTLIVDDTVIWRKILSDSLSSFPEIEVIGTASNGEIGLRKISNQKPDLVFLDVHMPEMNGIELLKRLNESFPDISVIMMSTDASSSTKATIEALQLGAIDFICKPSDSDLQKNIEHLKNDIKAILRLLEVRHFTSKKINVSIQSKSVVTCKTNEQTPKTLAIVNKEKIKNFAICVIGVSTGGPDALNKLIPAIPGTFPLPILLVQHMPPLFTKSLAESLNKKSQLSVKEGVENDDIVPGTVYIAPGGKHMILRMLQGKPVIGLNDEPPENSCRPSVDVLFRSVAAHYNNFGVLAVILTGMGSDGLNGVRSLKRNKCFCITQSESTCVVYGMPRAVDEANLSDLSSPIDSIALEMSSLTRNSIFRY